MVRIIAFLIAVAALQFAAFAQSNEPSDAERAADAAGAVAARASGAIDHIDPDSTLPFGEDEAPAAYAGLPPLVGEEPVAGAAEQDAYADAPRGPAVRMIASPVVQALPAPPPAPVAAPSSPALASSSPFVIKSILPVEGTIRYGDWFWDESTAPTGGALVITVDLEARVISAFRDGHEIGTSVVLVGTQSHPTPLGTFPILTKERDNVSEKYNNAPMPWTLRLT
jgi:hypothetical protein